MRNSIWCLAILAIGSPACDDTARAVDAESREKAQEAKRSLDAAGKEAKREAKELKRDVETAADEVRKDAKEAVDEAARKIDAVDKSVARDVKDDDAPAKP